MIRANLFAPSGAPLQASGGDTSFPSHVYLRGIAAFARNAEDSSVNAIGASLRRMIATVVIITKVRVENSITRCYLDVTAEKSVRLAPLGLGTTPALTATTNSDLADFRINPGRGSLPLTACRGQPPRTSASARATPIGHDRPIVDLRAAQYFSRTRGQT